MTGMKQLIFCISFYLLSLAVSAQADDHKVIDRSGENGTIMYFFQKEEIQGSQFLKDDWMKAALYGDRGIKFESAKVKFDSYNNKFVFDRHDTTYELSSMIYTLYLYPNEDDTAKKIVFKKGYAINNRINANKFLQVIAEGKLSLLKYYSKDLEEYTEYGNATKFKRFKDMEQYYVLQNGQYSPISISPKNLENQMQSKWTEVQAYMKKNNLSAKNEKDWATLISYYNSL